MTFQNDWKAREQGRLDSGYYPPLPPEWADLEPIPDHFAHISISVPTMISYTESPSMGMRDIQTRIRPWRYLARFYPDIRNRLVSL